MSHLIDTRAGRPHPLQNCMLKYLSTKRALVGAHTLTGTERSQYGYPMSHCVVNAYKPFSMTVVQYLALDLYQNLAYIVELPNMQLRPAPVYELKSPIPTMGHRIKISKPA